MTKEESIEAYRQIIGFLVFKDGLSSAVLIANSAERGIGELESRLKASQQDDPYVVPG